MPTRFRTATFLFIAGCAAQASDKHDSTQPSAAPAGELPAIAVDETRPMGLDQWREVQREGKKAAQTEDLAQRIAECRKFAAQHGSHQQLEGVLEALTDAVLEHGDPDRGQLADILEQRCALDKDDYELPLALVGDYYLKHQLDPSSALRQIEQAYARIEKDRQERLAFETDARQRQRIEASMAYRRVRASILEGRVHLQAGQPKRALEAAQRAEEAMALFGGDFAVHDANNKPVAKIASGGNDGIQVIKAAAYLALDDAARAKAELGAVVGLLGDVELRALYEQMRDALGLRPSGARDVSTDPLPAQVFELEDLTGAKVKLSDYRGKVVLVAFWATWCGPCKRELPELQKFVKEHRDRGVELLAISIDDFNARPKVEPFLRENNLAFKVLFEDPKQLTSYDYAGIPALYVIDREGRVASARTGFDPQLKDKLRDEVLPLVDNKREARRKLFAIEAAPAGFDVRWMQAVDGDLSSLAIAAPVAGKAGEVGALGRQGLMRWSVDGKLLGSAALTGYRNHLEAADLDGNGSREWVVGGWQSLAVLDASGQTYWEHKTERMAEIAGIRDFNGDGFGEIAMMDNGRVVIMKSVPQPFWKTPPLKDPQALVLDPNAGVVVQTDGRLIQFATNGTVSADRREPPANRILNARMATPAGIRDIFSGEWSPKALVDFDIDGDGRNDIVIADDSGVVAYDQSGKTLLKIRSGDVGITATAGELDGLPGAELAIAVDHYGLVVLGRKT